MMYKIEDYIKIPIEKLNLKFNSYDDFNTKFFKKLPKCYLYFLDNSSEKELGLNHIYMVKINNLEILNIDDIIEFLKIYLSDDYNAFSEYKIKLFNDEQEKFNFDDIDRINNLLFYKCQILMTNLIYDYNTLKPNLYKIYCDKLDDINYLPYKYVPHTIHIKTLEKYDKNYIRDLLTLKIAKYDYMLSYTFKDMEIKEIKYI